MDPSEAYGLVLLATAVPLYGLASVAFLRRRGEAMVRVRIPAVVAMINAFSAVFQLVGGARLFFGMDSLPCGVQHASIVCVVAIVVLYLARLHAMWCRAKNTEEMVELYERAARLQLAAAARVGDSAPARSATPPPSRVAAAAEAPPLLPRKEVLGLEGPGPAGLRWGRARRVHPVEAAASAVSMPSAPLSGEESVRSRAQHGVGAPISIGGDLLYSSAKRWQRPSFIGKVAVTVAAVAMLVPAAVVVSVDPALIAESRERCMAHGLDLIVSVYVVVAGVCSVRLSRRMSSVVEAFRIRDETHRVGLVSMFFIACYLPFALTEWGENADRDTGYSIMLNTALPASVAVLTTLWPLRLAAQERRALRADAGIGLADVAPGSGPGTAVELARTAPAALEARESPDVTSLASLEGVLRCGAARELYRSFCASEYNVENLMLWKEVERFRLSIEANSALPHDQFVAFGVLRAEVLWREYVRVDAPMQANLPSHVVHETEALVLQLMREARRCVSALIRRRSATVNGGTGGGAGGAVVLHVPCAPVAKSRVGSRRGCIVIDSRRMTTLGRQLSTLERESRVSASSEGIALTDSDGTPYMTADEVAHMFDAAQRTVRKLMAFDSFPRFRLSPQYKKAAESAVANESRRLALSSAGLG